MFVGLRKYKVRRGAKAKILQSVNNFLPIVESIPGFQYYHCYDLDEYILAVSAFTRQESVEESHRKALDWVRNHAGNLVEGRPIVDTCEVLISA